MLKHNSRLNLFNSISKETNYSIELNSTHFPSRETFLSVESKNE